MTKISILLLTHNRADDLLALLESLSQQMQLEYVLEEVLILNNASTESYDDVERFIKENKSLPIQLINNAINLGVAKGRNFLMQKAKSPLLLTIDDDMVFPQPDALLKMSQLFEKPFFKNSNTAIITLKVIYFDTKQQQVTAFPHKKFEKYVSKENFHTLFFAGGANLMRKEALAKTGYFPENFFYGMEEYDLAYRIIDAGYTIGYDDTIVIEHKESPYGRQANYKKLQMQWVNKSIVAWRYLPLQYFFSTSIMWSFQFLKTAYLHPITYLQSWLKVLSIPFQQKRKPINTNALKYLKEVEARLWY